MRSTRFFFPGYGPIVVLIALLATLTAVACSEPPGAPTSDGTPLGVMNATSTTPVTAGFDPSLTRVTTLRGRFLTAPGDRATASRDFLTRHAAGFRLRPDLSDLRLARQTDDLGGAVVTFQQFHGRARVFGGGLLVGFDRAGAVIHVQNDYLPDLSMPTEPRITAAEALAIGERHLGATFPADTLAPELVVVEGGKGFTGHRLAWQVTATLAMPLGSWFLFVDAVSGEMVRTIYRLKHAGPDCIPCNPATDSACGSFFPQNPIDASDDTSLRDTSNVDAFQAGCKLNNLSSSTRLDGLYATTVLTPTRVGPPYNYLRSANQRALDELTTYYAVNRTKEYLNSLGFPNVMNFAIKINAADPAVGENAYYDPSVKELHFGEGGVDDAQDIDVAYHENGHAIQDNQVPNYGTTFEGGAQGEAFGDIWAASLTESDGALMGTACVGSWDATAYKPYTGAPGSGCLRRVDGSKMYPRDFVWEVHDDGEIYSSALWALRGVLGAAVFDPLVIKSHTYLTPISNFAEGATAMLTADVALNGGANAQAIHDAFKARGLPRTGTPASSTGPWTSVPFVCETVHNYAINTYKECTFTRAGASRIRFHFSRFGSESGWDFGYVSDADYRQVQKLTGTLFSNGPGYSSAVSGDKIVLRFKADSSVNGYGFRIDSVEYVQAGCTSDAQCADANACNGAETCQAGTCAPGTPLTCGDGNACNGIETCSPATGCVAAAPLNCDDGNACNGVETCSPATGCVSGTPVTCDDGNPCTVETCAPATGSCLSSPVAEGAPCSDGNACNGAETCRQGACAPGTPLTCDDGNVCTGTETCNPATGCVAGTPLACSDGNLCNGAETCNPTTGCGAGTPLSCDDGNTCTTDACNPASGCTHTGSCAPTIRASDGFESGNFSGGTGWLAAWTVSGETLIRSNVDGPHGGTRHVRLRSSTGLMTRRVNLTGAQSVRLRFWAKVNSFEPGDTAVVRVSSDGTTYTTVKTFSSADSNNTYKFYDIALSGSLGANVSIRFDANMSSTSDSWFIDDVEVVAGN